MEEEIKFEKDKNVKEQNDKKSRRELWYIKEKDNYLQKEKKILKGRI